MSASRRTTAPIHRASKLRPSSRAVPYATTGRRGEGAAAVDPELPEHATTATATTVTATPATAIRRRRTRPTLAPRDSADHRHEARDRPVGGVGRNPGTVGDRRRRWDVGRLERAEVETRRAVDRGRAHD